MAGTEYTAEMIRQRVPMDKRLENPQVLNGLLRHMSQWRQTMLGNRFVHLHGLTIYSGPFKGMDYLDYSTEGCLLPRLLGTYEAEIHDDIEAFAAEGIEAIVDIGCAEGYYAVGLARAAPTARVHAFDTEERARIACAQLATKNGVADRVIIGETFTGDMFERFVDQRTLVMIDTEGFEMELMKPDLWPALKRLNIIMETHPIPHPDVVAEMHRRFSPTHDIVVRKTRLRSAELPSWMDDLPHLDQLLATWEFRSSPTPWFVMRPKTDGGPA